MLAMEIQRTEFQGLDAVEIRTDRAHMVIVTAFGPRIASFGTPQGENLLLWAPGKYLRGEWDLRGGHRVWATRPGADECEDTYQPDNGPCHVDVTDDSVCITGAEDPVNKTMRGIAVTVLDNGAFEVNNFVVNTGDLLYSGGVWALTCSLPSPETTYGVTIGDGSNWDSFNMVHFREWAGHGQGGFADDQITVREDLVHVAPRGVENKRMLLSHDGIIGMSDPARGLTFAKQCGYEAGGNYPLGCNIAFYIGPDNFMVEMETMGPEHTLKPGEDLHHVETWVLHDAAVSLDDAAGLRQLFAD